MPKPAKYPKLRTYVKKGAAGQRWVSYAYDNRANGKPDIPLGTDYEEALRRWHEIHFDAPRIAGTLEEAFRQWEADVLPNYASAETRRGYTKNLRSMRPYFGPSRWAEVTLKRIKAYLNARSGKTQANREASLLRLIWNWARVEELTDKPFPAAGMERSNWKNKEGAREREVTDEQFAAVYRHADQVLRDAMDIATATGLRVMDVIGLRLSDVRKDRLHVKANKTGKAASFELAASVVLPPIIERRRAMRGPEHLFLLADGRRPVTYRRLNDRFVKARALAVADCPEVEGLFLRDMRKRAAQLSEDLRDASELLQHSSEAVTKAHYRPGSKLKPIR